MRALRPALAAALALSACGGGGGGGAAPNALIAACPVAPAAIVSGETRAVFDLSGAGGFFDLPFPTDLRLGAGGHPDLAGFPNPKGLAIVRAHVETAGRDNVGWDTTQPTWIRFTGRLDAARLPRDPAAYASPSAPIQLVDVDPASPERGRRLPLEVRFKPEADSYRPENLLEIHPVYGIEPREGTTYALVVTHGVCGSPQAPLAEDPALTALLRGENPGGALGARARDVYAPLAAQLAREGIDPSAIRAATVFTTGTLSDKLYDIADRIDRFPAPAPLGALARTEDFGKYCVLSGKWRAPHFQDGTPPFLPTGGEFRFDAAGDPAPQGSREAPFVVTFPKRAMPAAGFPLLFYVHGTGGLSTQVYRRGEQYADGSVDEDGGPAEIAAERGWGASGMGGFLSIEHLGPLSLDGYVYNNFFNPPAMRDNFMQMVAEYMLFRRLLLDLRVDPALCPGADASAAPDGRLRFDPDMNVVIGQSLGGFLTSLLMTVEPLPWQGAIPLATGGTWTLFPLEAEDPPLGELVEDLILGLPDGERLDPWHPVLAAVQMALAPSENVRFLRYALRDPRRGRVAPHVLHIQGYRDLQTTTGLQRPVVSALGVDMVGPEVGPFPDGQILPAILLAGGRQLPYPVSLNFEVPGQGLRTAVVARYEEDGLREGHYVSFQREEPKHQYGCFLEDLARGRAPIVTPGRLQGDPCAP